MNAVKNRLTLRPSRARLIIWGVCLVVVVVLLVRNFDFSVSGPRPGPGGAEAAAVPADPDDDGFARVGPPAVRFGVLPRAAHLTALAGLQMNVYAAAVNEVRPGGWIETLIYDRAQGIRRGLEVGDLDVAAVPIRDAVALFLEMGEKAPRIVAGAALGDEMYITGAAVEKLSLDNLAPVRIGVLESPLLDVRAALGLDADNPPTVLLTAADSLSRSLLTREIDLAVAPEPLASHAAVLSGSHVFNPAGVENGKLAGGAVLVVAAEFLERQRNLVGNLVRAHDTTSYYVNQSTSVLEAATLLLKRGGRVTSPEAVWQKSLAEIEFSTEIPLAELEFLLAIAQRAAQVAETATLDGLVVSEFQIAARREREEMTGDK